MEDSEGSCRIICDRCYRGLGRLGVLFFFFCVIEDLERLLSYSLLSMLYRTWKVGCPILCYLCYRGLGGLVVLYFALCVMEDLEG